jgi:hypothetical protein
LTARLLARAKALRSFKIRLLRRRSAYVSGRRTTMVGSLSRSMPARACWKRAVSL